MVHPYNEHYRHMSHTWHTTAVVCNVSETALEHIKRRKAEAGQYTQYGMGEDCLFLVKNNN